ncbi:OLC1v1028396C1 [Oldenlandia corymbosa var. corymbosa]|uniref:OLC1v1028396C1 n=1 Tax=Oldenlandia corymbosa var. corymbosa TaxID=529605 RepID=A0AAV1CBV7_OLDCO|nr:OLC1v1028396C1 [Oldenlandia corymbosa var. corymbosa]
MDNERSSGVYIYHGQKEIVWEVLWSSTDLSDRYCLEDQELVPAGCGGRRFPQTVTSEAAKIGSENKFKDNRWVIETRDLRRVEDPDMVEQIREAKWIWEM